MNTEEFAKTTLVTKVDDNATVQEDNGDYVVSQNKTILRIFAICAIALSLIFWIYAVNSSIVTQSVKITAEEAINIKSDNAEDKAILDSYSIPEFTFDIKGRKNFLEDKAFSAEDFDITVIGVNTLESGYEIELSIEPKSSKIFLSQKGTVKVKLEPKIEVLPNA